MEHHDFIRSRVRKYYWEDDLNCATTTLKVMSEHFGIDLAPQILDAATGMHGAGGYGAQCGLVEGTLMFLGIVGRARGISDDDIFDACQAFARQFEQRFSSLLCRELRPEGFHSGNPPHLCEALTCRAIDFSIELVRQSIFRRAP